MESGSKFRTTGQDAYEFSYKTDYAVDVRITSFDPEGNPVISVVLCEAYPNYIGDVQQDWEDKNSNMILPLSMTFRDWYEEETLLGQFGSIVNSVMSVENTLSKIGEVVDTAQFISKIF
jgi:hypothetical protein